MSDRQSTAQNATGQNATGQIENASAIDQVAINVLKTLAAPGYANTANVTIDGKPTPLSYKKRLAKIQDPKPIQSKSRQV